VSDAGTATALIIASAPIEDGYYVIPAGRFVAATVLAVLTVPEEEGNTYRFSVTNLPFLLGQQETPGHYSDAELIPLSTKYEALHYQRDSE